MSGNLYIAVRCQAAPGSTFTIRKGSSLPTSRPGGSCQRRVRLRREYQPGLSQLRQEPLYDAAGLEGLRPVRRSRRISINSDPAWGPIRLTGDTLSTALLGRYNVAKQIAPWEEP